MVHNRRVGSKGVASPPDLFQVGSQGVNQVVGCLRLLTGRRSLWIEDMEADVSLDHLGHKSVHRTSAGGNVMQHLGTFGPLIERPFDSIHLAADPPYAIEQLFLFFLGVSHKKMLFKP